MRTCASLLGSTKSENLYKNVILYLQAASHIHTSQTTVTNQVGKLALNHNQTNALNQFILYTSEHGSLNSLIN